MGPVVQETGPKEAPVLTYPDLLQNDHDEKLFDYYLNSQLTLLDVKTGRQKNLGRPSIFSSFDVSPFGRYVLVERIHPPYSYQSPAQFFPRSTEVWDLKASVKHVTFNLLRRMWPRVACQCSRGGIIGDRRVRRQLSGLRHSMVAIRRVRWKTGIG